ncbi:MAG: redoxin domain-containing protein [Gemmatimonadales bacterium]
MTGTKTVQPVIGVQAPDFALPSTTGAEVRLSGFRGDVAVLLAFYPLAFTGTCTAELCGFSEALNEFERTGTKVLGVSVDSVPTLREFQAKHDIRIELLSDFKREASRLYGTLLEHDYYSNRSYFVIDRNGVLRWSYTEQQLGDKRSNTELIEVLNGLE